MNELDELSDISNDLSKGRDSSLVASRKQNFCEYREPYEVEVEELFNKTETKSFLVPCSELEGSVETRNKRDLCKVFRYALRLFIFQHFDLLLFNFYSLFAFKLTACCFMKQKLVGLG